MLFLPGTSSFQVAVREQGKIFLLVSLSTSPSGVGGIILYKTHCVEIGKTKPPL